jgi:pimeloyl-ACP methyl ester carboxylesterase
MEQRASQPEPFEVSVADTVLDDLRARLSATRWPCIVGDDNWAYGAPVEFMQELASYWSTQYDWRAAERAINDLPHFRVRIDGFPIHFVHVRGKGPSPVPLILTHGWPWTFWDFAEVIGPLTDPERYGGEPGDAFDVVIPSLPGFAFSTPAPRGVNVADTAELWAVLMRDVLGYNRYGAQGGDYGALVSAQLGHCHADNVIGVHLSTPNVLSVNWRGLRREDFAPGEESWFDAMQEHLKTHSHLSVHSTDPQTLAFALQDSPVGLAAWLIERRRNWSDCGGDVYASFDRDMLLTTVMLYWVTGSIGSSMRFYYESARRPWHPSDDSLPVIKPPTAVQVFPRELIFTPRRLAEERANLKRWTVMPSGGHFAPAEEPRLLAADLRSFFRELRG